PLLTPRSLPTLFRSRERVQYRFMFGTAAYHVFAFALVVFKYTFDSHVDGFRCPRRKGDFLVCSADECRNPFPRSVHRSCGCTARDRKSTRLNSSHVK